MARRDSEEDKQADGQTEQQMEGNQTEHRAAGETRGASASERGNGGMRGPARVASERYSEPVIEFLRGTLSGTLQATGAVATDAVDVAREVLTGAVRATEQVGTETLGAVGTLGNGVVTTARDLLVGGVGGVRQILGSALPQRAAKAAEEKLHGHDA